MENYDDGYGNEYDDEYAARHTLGVMYSKVEWYNQDFPEFPQDIFDLAEQGDAKAQHHLGEIYEEGYGVLAPNSTKAVEWYRKAAEQGYSDSQYVLGYMCYYGINLDQDYVQAAGFYRKAAEQGHFWAQFNLARMYAKGQGVEQNDEEALRWVNESSKQGHPKGHFSLERLKFMNDN